MSTRSGTSDGVFWGGIDDDTALSRYRALVETIDDGLYQLDASGRFVAVNDTIVETTGYARDELIGEHVSLLVDDEDIDVITREIAAQVNGESNGPETFELAVRSADGEPVPCELRITSLIDDEGFQGTVGIVRDISERTRQLSSLESVRKSYEPITNVLDEANIAVFVLDDEFEVAWADETVEEYFGLDRGEIVGRDKRQLIEETIKDRFDDPERFMKRVLATYDDNTDLEQFECQLTAGDDREERWLEHHSKPIESGRYEGGRLELYYDITDRKRSEDALRESEEQFESLVDAVEEYAIFRLDPDGRIISWNEGAAEIKGYDHDEILGEHFSTFYTETDRATGVPERNLDRADESGSVEDEGWRVRKDDTQFWANVTITAIRDDDGTHRGYLKVARDMTDRYERERELESELQRVFGRISDAFFAVDEEFRFTHVNERAKELLDYQSEELVGENVWDLFEWGGDSKLRDEYEEAMESQEPTSFELYYPDPLDTWFEINAYPSQTGLSVYFRDITDRKSREQELAKYETIVETVNDGIYVVDDDGHFTMVNDAYTELTGYSRSELLGSHISLVADDETVGRVKEMERAMAEGTVGEPMMEALLRTADGDRVPAEATFSMFPGDERERIGVARDVTERKERERRLRKSEQRHRTLAENFPNGTVTMFDDDLRYTLAAGQAFDYLPVSSSDLEGRTVGEVWPDHTTEILEPAFQAALDGRTEAVEFEYADREWVVRVVPITNDDGTVFSGMTIAQDITERKERERTLERSANQQQAVADIGQFALEVDDLDELMDEAVSRVAEVLDNEYCKVLDLDDDAEELLLRQGVGWDDGIVGDATVSAVEDDSQAAYTLTHDRPIVVEDLETESRFSGPELLTSHDVRSGISTIVGPADDPWGILGTHDTERRAFTNEDVTFVQSVANVLAEAIERHQYQNELERLVADLEESNERLEQFAYVASHDLQEPLRMVTSYLQLIERRYGDALDEDGEEFLEFAVDGAERMREMIDGLLAYSRIETQGDAFEPVDLNAVFEDVREDLRMQIEESDAEITAEALPRVEGDASQLRQLFQNLLQNAIEYSGDEPPRIDVSAERDGEQWHVAVRDEGIGIDPDATDRIFEVFQRLHTREEQPGTGIGLALCRRIVERHGGEIRVDSEPGEGSTFSVTLPVADSSVE